MPFPSKHKLKKMREKLEKAEGSIHLNESATPLEKFRYQICQKILAFKQDHNMKQRDVAKQLGIDEAIVSKILHHRIEKISTDKLIEYLQKLDPTTELKVS